MRRLQLEPGTKQFEIFQKIKENIKKTQNEINIDIIDKQKMNALRTNQPIKRRLKFTLNWQNDEICSILCYDMGEA